jgi:hypothetical protein
MLFYVFVFSITAFTLSFKLPSSLMLLLKERIEQGTGSDFYLNTKSLFLKLNGPAYAESVAALGADKNYGSCAAVVIKIKRNMKSVFVITSRTAGNFPL